MDNNVLESLKSREYIENIDNFIIPRNYSLVLIEIQSGDIKIPQKRSDAIREIYSGYEAYRVRKSELVNFSPELKNKINNQMIV
jgi:hypothetical protein